MIDEDGRFLSDKFDDCEVCKNKRKIRVCNSCDYGEEFESEDMDEVDKHFNGRI